MLSIYKSDKFQNEYNDFKTRIDKVDDLRLKSTLENLLRQLETKVKRLDSQHNELIMSRQMKSLGSDIKDELLDLRKSLDKKLKDFESR